MARICKFCSVQSPLPPRLYPQPADNTSLHMCWRCEASGVSQWWPLVKLLSIKAHKSLSATPPPSPSTQPPPPPHPSPLAPPHTWVYVAHTHTHTHTLPAMISISICPGHQIISPSLSLSLSLGTNGCVWVLEGAWWSLVSLSPLPPPPSLPSPLSPIAICPAP